MFHKLRKVILLFFIILVAWFFRFNNVNWDSGYHLHPDERFLTMVTTAMKLPVTINEYFNQKISLLNPGNIGYKFFVYGNFPLVINKYLAVFLKTDNYDQLTILGRQLSAFFDLLIIILVYKTTKLLLYNMSSRTPKGCGDLKYKEIASPSARNDNIALWAAFIYAVLVLPIQLSHFFAVDSFLNFFMFGSFYCALKSSETRTSGFLMALSSAVFFGLALACKVTALFIMPLILILLSLRGALATKQSQNKRLLRSLWSLAVTLSLFLLISYLILRIANPYCFQNQNFFDFTLSKDFVSNIQSLKSMTVKDTNNWYPPMVQWLSKNSFVHSVVNNTVFGFGIIPTAFLILGILKVVLSFPRRRESIPIFIILFWVLGFFTYHSLQTTPTLRYFIFLYPFFAIFAGIGINVLTHVIARGRLLHFVRNDKFWIVIIVIILLIWPLMFSSIYFHKNTRVEASEWIYKNLPNSSYILSESWDDSLPLLITNNYGKQFGGEQLPVFDPDTPEKWEKINKSLVMADYYILSSNRGWGSIPTVPKKYPLMSKFYEDLLVSRCHPERPSDSEGSREGSYCYKKIAEFTSYPQLKILNFKFQINDDWSDEGFTVYDHPKVLIYKNVKKY